MKATIEILEGIRAIIKKKLKKTDIENLILNKNIYFIEPSIRYQLKETDLELLNTFFAVRKDVTFLRILENSWLEHLSELTRLEFSHYAFNKDSIFYLKNLKKIDSLSFSSTGSKKTDISFLLEYKETLESLSISGNIKVGQECILSKLKNLKRIKLSYTKLENLYFLKELPFLEYILIEGSRIIDYSILNKLNNLKSIQIISNTILEDFSFLQNMPALEELYFMDCGKITEIPKLSHLSKLKRVCFMDCKNLKDWKAIEKLNKDKIKIFISSKELIYKNTDDF